MLLLHVFQHRIAVAAPLKEGSRWTPLFNRPAEQTRRCRPENQSVPNPELEPAGEAPAAQFNVRQPSRKE